MRFSLFLILFLIAGAQLYSQQKTDPLLGKWEGKLALPGAELRVFFEISKTTDGTLHSKMASPDQGASNIPVDQVVWRNDSLFLSVNVVGGTYSAKLSADQKQLNGVWKQGAGALPLNVKKTDVLTFYSERPQDPKKPYPYLEEILTYENNQANVSLGGTLTLPSGTGPFPIAILISGSGGQNRDGEIMGHKPFWVIADYLTRRGIAVLRVDDRGVGKSTGNANTATSADNASDVIAAINYLKSRKDIDSKKIGLIGHSEGGMIAPMVASQVKDLAFAVLMAGPGLPGDKVHRRQVEDIMRLNGSNESDISKQSALLDKIYAVIKANKDAPFTSMVDKLKIIIKEDGAVKEDASLAMAETMSTPWFRYFIAFDPAAYLQKVKCPVLAISGSKDIQVAGKENLKAIESSLRAGGNTNVTTKEIPGLNHLFQTATTGGPIEYAKIEETFSPGALKIMGDWLDSVVLK